MIKNIIFDFDGTIADTHKGIIKTFTETFDILGVDNVDNQSITSKIGLPLKQMFLELTGGDDEFAQRATNLYRDIFDDIATPAITLFEGVKECLTSLKNSGFCLSVASSRGEESLNKLVRHLELEEYFDIVCGEDSVQKGKPAPDLALCVMDKLGIKCDETLVVGDTCFDIEMGKGAGCLTCGVTFGNQSRKELEACGSNFIIDKFEDLTKIVVNN